MEIRKLFADDDAVSPVIGVILMVAITVILAAVIGAFVLGFGGGGPSAPSVQWDSSSDISTDDEEVTFTHGGGDDISNAGTVLSVTGPDGNNPDTDASVNVGGDQVLSTTETVVATFDGTDGSGSQLVTLDSGDEVDLVWEPESGDSSQILSTHTV